jgi:hypothetical protein
MVVLEHSYQLKNRPRESPFHISPREASIV